MQNEEFPNFCFVRPEVCTEKRSEFSPHLWGYSVLCFLGNGDHQKFTRNPRRFSLQNPQANKKWRRNSLESWQGKFMAVVSPLVGG